MLNRSASLAMSTSVLKALPGKLDSKRHSPSILYLPLLPLFVFLCWLVLILLCSTTVVPTKNDSDVIFCLQLLLIVHST